MALIGGSGGAVAIGATGGAAVRSKQKAAQSQYTPGKKTVKCKKGFHKVKNRCVRNKVVIKKKPSPKHLTGPAFTGARDHRYQRRSEASEAVTRPARVPLLAIRRSVPRWSYRCSARSS